MSVINFDFFKKDYLILVIKSGSPISSSTSFTSYNIFVSAFFRYVTNHFTTISAATLSDRQYPYFLRIVCCSSRGKFKESMIAISACFVGIFFIMTQHSLTYQCVCAQLADFSAVIKYFHKASALIIKG